METVRNETALDSQEMLAAYRSSGLAAPIRVLSAEQARGYAARCDELENALGGNPRTIEVRQMHLHFPWAYQLATSETILDEVEKLLGPDIVIWATELFAKQPCDEKRVIGWHRDEDYMGFSNDDVVTAWVALEDSIEANGCMKALPSAGRLDGSDLPVSDDPSGRISEDSIPMGQTVNVELQAGEMSLHDSRIVHGSGPNLSDIRRVGFAIRFIKAGAKPKQGRPEVVVARGNLQGDHFAVCTPPLDEPDMEDFKSSAKQHLKTLLLNLQRIPR